MKTVAVISNPRKDRNFACAKRVADALSGAFHIICGAKTNIPGVMAVNDNVLFSEADYVIVLGGDGTILNISRSACKKNLPVLGINMGNLGFLAEIERDNIESCLKAFKEGRFTLEKRSMITAKVMRSGRMVGERTALNDIVISRASFRRMIDLKLYIDGTLADRYNADGVIAATPTGSTAYSLSAGGPVVDPTLAVTVVTPICPHTLSSRSIIVPSSKNVDIHLGGKTSKGLVLTVDGQEGMDLANGDVVRICESGYKSTFIKIGGKSFYGILKKKMAKRGKNHD